MHKTATLVWCDEAYRFISEVEVLPVVARSCDGAFLIFAPAMLAILPPINASQVFVCSN